MSMNNSGYNKGIAHEVDTHGSFRLFPYHPNWNIDVYNLEMVIRLAYTIDSDNSRKFRQFIMNRLTGRPMYENICITIHMDDLSPELFMDISLFFFKHIISM